MWLLPVAGSAGVGSPAEPPSRAPRDGARLCEDDGVQISAKTDYAVRALLSLAAREPELVKIDTVVTEQGMPRKFVEAILGELRRAGLVRSQRGADGGYALARPASDIKLGSVIRAVDGPLAEVRGRRPHETEYAGVARTCRGVGRRPLQPAPGAGRDLSFPRAQRRAARARPPPDRGAGRVVAPLIPRPSGCRPRSSSGRTVRAAIRPGPDSVGWWPARQVIQSWVTSDRSGDTSRCCPAPISRGRHSNGWPRWPDGRASLHAGTRARPRPPRPANGTTPPQAEAAWTTSRHRAARRRDRRSAHVPGGRDGLLLPLYSSEAWYDGVNTAICGADR